LNEREADKGHIVATGFIDPRPTDRLPANAHAVVGISSFKDAYLREAKDANLEGTCLMAQRSGTTPAEA